MTSKAKLARVTPRIDAQGGSKSDAVIAAAIRLVESEGETALGWNRLAQELGVKPPSLYNHLKDAADLMRRVAIFAWSELHRETASAVARAESPEAALCAIATTYRNFAQNRAGLFAIANKTPLALDDPDFAPVATELLQLFNAPISDLGVPASHRVHAIRILRASIHGFVELERAGHFAMSAPVEETFSALLNALPALVAALRK